MQTLSVSPVTYSIISNTSDSLTIAARSNLFTSGEFVITEICQFKGSTVGAPSGGWPTYLVSDDFIEITGKPNVSLNGYRLQIWSTTGLQKEIIFGTNTLLGPTGTAIIGFGSNTSSANNFYFGNNAGNPVSFVSGDGVGYIIKDMMGNIVDAVAYSGNSGYTFPVASGVFASHWTGSSPIGSATTGIRLTGQDQNNGNNWVVCSATQLQTPNVLNASLATLTQLNPVGFSWLLGGSVISNKPNTVVGPFTTSGIYAFEAVYTTAACGTYRDTVFVLVNLQNPNCTTPSNVNSVGSTCSSVTFNWVNSSGASHIEYGLAGFLPGTGQDTLISTNSVTLNNLSSSTPYDIWITANCGTDKRAKSGPHLFVTASYPKPAADFTLTKEEIGGQLFLYLDGSNSIFADNYTWKYSNGTVSHGLRDTAVFSVNGPLSVRLIVDNACGRDSITKSTSINIGIAEEGLRPLDFSLYPNPSNGQFTLSVAAHKAGFANLLCMDVMGRVLFKQSLELLADENLFQVDLTGLAAGTYLIALVQGPEVVYKRIVIK